MRPGRGTNARRELAGLDAGSVSATDRTGCGRDTARCTIPRETNSPERRKERRKQMGGSAELQHRGVRLVSRGQMGTQKEEASVAKSKMRELIASQRRKPLASINTKLPPVPLSLSAAIKTSC
jgi:hypothetical protein